jgi:flagellin
MQEADLAEKSEKAMSTIIDSKTTLVALQGLKSANADATRASERLATGLRINRASDDPSGLARATKLNAEISSYTQVKRNINTALGQMGDVTKGVSTMLDYLAEMRILATASAGESDADVRTNNQAEFAELMTALGEVVAEVEFADTAVLSAGGSIKIQTGIDSGDGKTLTFTARTATALSINSQSISSVAAAGSAITAIDDAIDLLGGDLAKYGGYEKSLEGYSNIADAAVLSKSSTYGEIMNADLALEASNLAAAKIRQDTATAVLAQANSMNRNIADYLLNGILG